jgi:hypothetical protein
MTAQETGSHAQNAIQYSRQQVEDRHPHKKRHQFKEGDFSYPSRDHEIREILLEGGCTQFLKSIGNRGQGLPGKKPDFSRLWAIYAFDQNIEITVGGMDYPDEVFVRLEWISTGTLGLIADLVEPSRKTTIYDGDKLDCQSLGICTLQGSIQVERS